MKTDKIPSEFLKKSASLERLVKRVIAQPELLPEVFAGLDAQPARVKYGCLKLLRLISEREPAVLYPEINRVFGLLDSGNNIIKWVAIIITGNLAAVDSEGGIDRILDRYLQPISGHVLITAANVIGGAGKIAAAKPHLAGKIARALMQVEAAQYQTAECRNVALGHVVVALDLFFDEIKEPGPVVEFVRRQLDNPRNAVGKKAAKFLRKHVKPSGTGRSPVSMRHRDRPAMAGK